MTDLAPITVPAPQYCRTRINYHVIFYCRVALLATKPFYGILSKGEGTESNTLIDPNMVTDVSCLTYHHPNPVVDEKALPNIGAGMNVDSCKSVDVLAHNTWHKRDILMMKQVIYPIDCHSEGTAIAEDHLIVAPCCGV
jgi:hypothetical protein